VILCKTKFIFAKIITIQVISEPYVTILTDLV